MWLSAGLSAAPQRLLVLYQSLPLPEQIFITQNNGSDDSEPIHQNRPSFTHFRPHQIQIDHLRCIIMALNE